MKNLTARIRGAYYRLKYSLLNRMVSIGPGFKVYGRLQVKGKGRVKIGENCSISGMPGDRDRFVTLYTHSPQATLTIGNNVSLYGTKIGCMHEIVIGSEALIEEASLLDTDFHSIARERSAFLGETKDRCNIQIGKGVSIGAKSIVMKGVKIGAKAVVGPGSVVNRSLPPGCIALGNPIKVISRFQS